MTIHRTATTLADGRVIIYFDESERDRGTADKRDLPPRAGGSELRFDPLLDEWVAVATHRQNRTHLPPTTECPLCPSTPAFATEVPDSSYDVVVFENRFPSFSDVAKAVGEAPYALSPNRTGVGRCEVVCFTDDHTSAFNRLDERRVRTVMEAWTDRTAELSTMDDVEQVFIFENRGEEIGVTLHHPHGQIYGYPYVTPRTRRMLDSARATPDLFAGVLAAERAGPRVVASNAHWTAFVPAFARWPYEVHLYPHRQVPDLPALTVEERESFAPVYLEVLRRLDGMFGLAMPYVSGWHQAPVRADRDLAYLHLQLFSTRRAPGKLKYPAGSESAMWAFVNDVRPEDAAQALREVEL
jgi:UDPglucose--hexose-1-phosphate uridylyltransferase